MSILIFLNVHYLCCVCKLLTLSQTDCIIYNKVIIWCCCLVGKYKCWWRYSLLGSCSTKQNKKLGISLRLFNLLLKLLNVTHNLPQAILIHSSFWQLKHIEFSLKPCITLNPCHPKWNSKGDFRMLFFFHRLSLYTSIHSYP